MSDHSMGSPNGGSGCSGDCPSPAQLRLYQAIIFATPVLFAFMLLLMFCILYFKRRGVGTNVHSHMTAQFFVDGLLANPSVEQIQGLSRSFRQRLPIILYDDRITSTEHDSQCPVCLGDYQFNEKLQLLPACKHFFHVQCINEWLAKNNTCPICRTSLGDIETGGNAEQLHHPDAISIRERIENRTWEHRVSGIAQEQGSSIVPDGSSGNQHDPAALSENPRRPVNEHAVDIERS